MNWKKISEQKRQIDERIKQELFEHWNELTPGKQMPDMLARFLPENVDFYLFQDDSTIGNCKEHEALVEKLESNDGNGLDIYGSMDASQESDFVHLYNKHGWRTIIYLKVNIVQETIPGGNSKDLRYFMIQMPALLVSPGPDALTEIQLENAISAINTVLTAMLLRVGVTFLASHSQHLWDSIPGALLLISSDTIFQGNDAARQWLNKDLSLRDPIDITSVFPAPFCRWISETIGDKGIYTEEQGHCVIWLDDTKRVRVNLRPYKPWANVRATSRMSTGFRGIQGDDVHHRLHMLLLQDVTLEWEAESLQQEISVARRIQMGLQPERMPQTDVYDIVATCEPAKTIGGDLYDAVILPDERIALIIGDATGHGVHSALLAALVTGAFRGCVDYDPEPEIVLESIDRVLRNTNHDGFVTVVYMLLEANGGSFRYGLAGHYPPMLVRHDQELCQKPTPSSLPLGINLPSMYYFGECELRSGDVIAAFSDGLLECRNSDDDTFHDKIPGIIRKAGKLTPHAILNELLHNALEFAKENIIDDDLTAIIIKVKSSDTVRNFISNIDSQTFHAAK
jgi:serine phosphatase RsbU (regulator of sigma subunit)